MLSPTVSAALKPLLEVLPLERAMNALVVDSPAGEKETKVLQELLRTDAHLRNHPVLEAGLWIYLDDLQRSHDICQLIEDTTGSFWHGIMHRREGDFANSHYWFHKVGRHPAMAQIPGYDPHVFIDRVELRDREEAEALIALQRREWAGLFNWCWDNHEGA